ncbi:hypothetical protein Tsubulata_021293 [Turnera subulata]|uniref:Disease resistance protein At4g27190-like leucine-rich repeats domain-containing protein n=1 Tax=Turnera subulata TaxID=218843 RepID=A0A9Q0JI92_9ROSI|nr:hypothetical protein Tsubulata_021293 [Turnera subulata]
MGEDEEALVLFEEAFFEGRSWPGDLSLQRINNEKLWQSKLLESSLSFGNLKQLVVRGCDNLKYVFPFSMVKCLARLKHLTVERCEVMEEIVSREGMGEEEKMQTLMFPKLECPVLRKVSIEYCNKLKTFMGNIADNDANKDEPQEVQPLFDEKVAFPFLFELSLQNIDELEKIWPNQPGWDSFCKLKSLAISSCHKLVNIFPSNSLRIFESRGVVGGHLEKILEVEVVEEMHHDVAFFQLRQLDLSPLHKLRHIWSTDPQGNLNFSKLHSVRLWSCPTLQDVFPFSVAKNDLLQLEELRIWSCRLEEIVALQENGEEPMPCFVFPRLTSLNLLHLPGLKGFYAGQHTLDCPVLKELEARNCAIVRLFGSAFVNCYKSSGGTEIMEAIVNLLPATKILRLIDLEEESAVFQSNFLRLFPILERFGVYRSSFRELSLPQGCANKQLHRLKTLEMVKDCERLVNLAPSFASFENLTSMNVYGCDKLLCLVTTSTARSLVKLVELEVAYCDKLTEIVIQHKHKQADIGTAEEHEVVFTKLKNMFLGDLKNISSFCSGNCMFKFPSLEKLIVQACPKMQIFSHGRVTAPKLGEVIHRAKVAFDGVESLELSAFPQLEERQHGELSVKIFGRLGRVVYGMLQLQKAGHHGNDTQRHHNHCNESMQKIFDLEGLNGDEGPVSVLPSLRKLHMKNLPRLRCLWSGDPQGILPLSNLQDLRIDSCSSLRNIFTTSVVLGLCKLWRMEVKNCSMLEEIITTDGAEGTSSTDKIMFPRLRLLTLESLPNLTTICPAIGIKDFPALREITLEKCQNMKTFISSFLTGDLSNMKRDKQKGQSSSNGACDVLLGSASADHDKFHQVSFPNLDKLRVEWNDISGEMGHYGQFQEELFGSLKILELINFPSTCMAFPSHFLQKFTCLDTLTVSNAFFEAIILHAETNGTGDLSTAILPKLKKLKLSKLSILVHLSEELQPNPCLQNLETLKLLECGRLKRVVPPGASFQCIMTLKVSKCHSLVTLFSTSTAKCLVQLQRVIANDCEMLVNIVVDDENEPEDEALLSNLERECEIVRNRRYRVLGGQPKCHYTKAYQELEQTGMGSSPKPSLETSLANPTSLAKRPGSEPWVTENTNDIPSRDFPTDAKITASVEAQDQAMDDAPSQLAVAHGNPPATLTQNPSFSTAVDTLAPTLKIVPGDHQQTEKVRLLFEINLFVGNIPDPDSLSDTLQSCLKSSTSASPLAQAMVPFSTVSSNNRRRLLEICNSDPTTMSQEAVSALVIELERLAEASRSPLEASCLHHLLSSLRKVLSYSHLLLSSEHSSADLQKIQQQRAVEHSLSSELEALDEEEESLTKKLAEIKSKRKNLTRELRELEQSVVLSEQNAIPVAEAKFALSNLRSAFEVIRDVNHSPCASSNGKSI